VVLVAALLIVCWFWVRPWWQARELTQALESIPGVASVDPAPDDWASAEHPYVLRFADDVTAAQLSRGVRAIDRAVDDHRIAGDAAGVEVRADGFVLGHSEDYPLPVQVARAVVALRDVEGLTGIEADDSEVTMSVASEIDLLPIGQEVLRALSGPELDTTANQQRTRLRIVVKNGGPFVDAQLADVRGQLSLLEQLADAADAAGAVPARGDSSSSSISFYGATNGDDAACSALLRVGPDVDLEAASRTLIARGPRCITVMAKDGPTLDLRGRRPVPAPALALRRQLQEVGADLVRANMSLSSVEVSIDGARSLEGLIELTRDRDAWTVPDDAELRVSSGGGFSAVFDGDDVSLLQENGTLLVAISRAGFRTSVDGGPDGLATIGVSDDIDGAPDLTTDGGQQALVGVLRQAGFDGSVRITVDVDDQPSALSFTSTASGKAEDVQEPTEAYDPWADRLLEAWNTTAG
jgi:hypothetical protein